MDMERARNIIESHGVIEVQYQEEPVWIETLNPDQTVQVSFINTEQTVAVPVSELSEA